MSSTEFLIVAGHYALAARTATPIGLAAVAKMLVKFSARLLVPINILLNRLGAAFLDICFCKNRTYLLATPWLIAKLGLDLFQSFGSNREFLLLAGFDLALGSGVMVIIICHTIAPQFATNRRDGNPAGFSVLF